MINAQEYFGKYHDHPAVTKEHRDNADTLLLACANLEQYAKADGVKFPVNPATGTEVSGSGNGGWRPPDCPVGAPGSSHKEGLAVDRYDPHGDIDAWCMLNSGKGGLLEKCGIYIEHPSKTETWSHWTIKAPGSGRRVFYP